VRADNIDLFRLKSRSLQRQMNALGLAFRVGQDKVGGIRIDCVSSEFTVNLRATGFRVAKSFQRVNAATFGDHDSGPVHVKRTAGLSGVGVNSERILTIKTCENAEGVNAFAGSTGECQIAFVKPQHLRPLNQPGVASSTSGTDGVMRPSNAHVQRDFAGRVVRNGTWIVVVRPTRCVVIKTFDDKNLVFCLDISVLRDADVNANARFIEIRPVNAGVLDRFVGRINPDAAGASPTTDIFFGLVATGIEIANARQCVAEISDCVGANTAALFQQCVAEGRPIVAVRRGQTDAGNDNSLRIRQQINSRRGDHD